MPLALLCGALIFSVFPAFAQSPSLAGKWNWGAGGGVVEIDPSGAGRDARGNTLRWTLRDPASRTYVLTWSHGYTDTAVLSADGNALSATNNQGLRFTAARVGGAPVAGTTSGGAIAGQWNWGAGGGVVEIDSNGTGRDPRGNTLRWTLRDIASRTYVLTWSHGYTDTAVLSADGNTLSATNNQGLRFTAARRTAAPATTPTPIAPVNLNGSWSGGVHIWQDGTEVLVTATWKRDDGKYVIWRGEGRLNGRAVDLVIRYSPMTHGAVPEWRGVFAISPDGDKIDAAYSVGGVVRDRRTYIRER